MLSPQCKRSSHRPAGALLVITTAMPPLDFKPFRHYFSQAYEMGVTTGGLARISGEAVQLVGDGALSVSRQHSYRAGTQPVLVWFHSSALLVSSSLARLPWSETPQLPILSLAPQLHLPTTGAPDVNSLSCTYQLRSLLPLFSSFIHPSGPAEASLNFPSGTNISSHLDSITVNCKNK